MNKFSSIAASLVVMILIINIVEYTTFQRDARRQFVEMDIDIGVNYAVQGAVQEMVTNSEDLRLDYSDWQFLEINPEIALNTYSELLCRNLGYTPTEENKSAVLIDNTPCFVVACYDGYYIAKPTPINEAARDMIFSSKIPYMYYDNSDTSTSILYGLNLGLNDAKRFIEGAFTKVKTDTLLTKERQLQIINSRIADDMMSTIFEQRSGTMRQTVYIPSQVTTTSVTNPIVSPSVLAYVDNVYLGAGEPMQSFAIGGTRVEHQDFVAGYMRDGHKYYSYSRLIPDTITVIKVFQSIEQAAADGFYYDYMYMDK